MTFRIAKAPRLTLAAAALALGAAVPATANEFEPQLRDLVETQVRGWLGEATLVDAVKAQNDAHAGISDADIDGMDQQWRAEAEAGGGALIDEKMGHDLSAWLAEVKNGSDGLFTEIFVMDAHGLNVGQSDVTSDYMQGDEAKWQETYLVGADAVFVDELEFDESTNAFQSQVSATVADPATGDPIGAITVGVNVEKLF
ncbi:MAG: hypothetical protein GVY28_04535 [Alphaproteobacteria bacterium]|jgi:hypothetical protein|nr:hypothetical protein [Alphaproteobacteria bacterium]